MCLVLCTTRLVRAERASHVFFWVNDRPALKKSCNKEPHLRNLLLQCLNFQMLPQARLLQNPISEPFRAKVVELFSLPLTLVIHSSVDISLSTEELLIKGILTCETHGIYFGCSLLVLTPGVLTRCQTSKIIYYILILFVVD